MAVIQSDDVVGYHIDQEHVCKECATQEEIRDVTLDDIITVHSIDGDNRYFCDRCKEELLG